MADGDKWDTPQLVYPTADLRVNPNAPRDIRLAFDEACNCYRAGAFTASAIMCRKTLEGTCAAHGVTEGSLARSLRKMHEQNLIDGRLFEWSDLMRAAGNEAAPGVGLSIEQADAKDILEFTNAIMDYLFSFRDRFEEWRPPAKRSHAEMASVARTRAFIASVILFAVTVRSAIRFLASGPPAFASPDRSGELVELPVCAL